MAAGTTAGGCRRCVGTSVHMGLVEPPDGGAGLKPGESVVSLCSRCALPVVEQRTGAAAAAALLHPCMWVWPSRLRAGLALSLANRMRNAHTLPPCAEARKWQQRFARRRTYSNRTSRNPRLHIMVDACLLCMLFTLMHPGGCLFAALLRDVWLRRRRGRCGAECADGVATDSHRWVQ